MTTLDLILALFLLKVLAVACIVTVWLYFLVHLIHLRNVTHWYYTTSKWRLDLMSFWDKMISLIHNFISSPKFTGRPKAKSA